MKITYYSENKCIFLYEQFENLNKMLFYFLNSNRSLPYYTCLGKYMSIYKLTTSPPKFYFSDSAFCLRMNDYQNSISLVKTISLLRICRSVDLFSKKGGEIFPFMLFPLSFSFYFLNILFCL